jgi:hypothetical protein
MLPTWRGRGRFSRILFIENNVTEIANYQPIARSLEL